jgi:hypothetical protein
MNKKIIAGSLIVAGGLYGVYSVLTKDNTSFPYDLYAGLLAIMIGGEIAKERKKTSNLVREVVEE